MLRRLRMEQGKSLSDLSSLVHYSKGYLSNVELGRKPATEDMARACDLALNARGELIATAHLDQISRRDSTPWQTAELLHRIQASDTAPSTLDSLHATVTELCCEYPYRDASELRSEAHGWLDQVAKLLRKPVGHREHTELLVAAGWPALLVGCLEYDLGMRVAAESTRAAARQLGEEAGHNEIVGWTYEMSAWFALTQGRYQDVVTVAQAGQQAGSGHSVEVQLIAQEAKARARIHDTAGIAASLDRGRDILSLLPQPERTDHHFVVDPSKWDFYAMDVSRLAGDDTQAEQHAEVVLTEGVMPDGTERSPMRMTEARLTLAAVASRRGDLEQAVNIGLTALNTDRRSLPSLLMVSGELDNELRRRFPGETRAAEFHEALRNLR
jgi:transcriptional regulator with XRE-family HTH domain